MELKTSKIIIFIGTLQSGGAERVVSELSSFYAGLFDEVIILTYYDRPVFYSIDARIRLECVEKEVSKKNILLSAYWIRKFVTKENPEVFMSFLMPFNMLSIVSLLFTKIKLVVCERQDPSNVKSKFLRTIRNLLYHFCDRIEVQTLSGKQYFSRLLKKKIWIIPNPNHITREERDESLSVKKENIIASVGRLIPLKNQSLLVSAFSKVYVYHPEYKLIIYGEGELRDTLIKQIESLGLSDVVFLPGRTDNIAKALSNARVFVLSSNVEGMPNALMEAMALGVPSISTDVSGARDIITDGINGFITPVNSEEHLVEKMLLLVESIELQRSFSSSSKSVLDKFDKNVILNQWHRFVMF